MPHHTLRRSIVSLFALTTIVSCSNPSAPTPPPAAGTPTLTCPGDIQRDLLDGTTTAVDYPLPQASGGTAPLSVACAIPSGSQFAPGATDVTCSATDAASRTAQCSFRVTVTLVPRLRGTRIVAFGNSITAGEVSPPFGSSVRYLDQANSYPALLQQMLRDRYTAQEIVVFNEGIPGEQVLGTGEGRIEQLAVDHQPDVLIVLEGVNALNTANADAVSEGLRRGVRRAVARGVPLVLVSTILPGVEGRTKPPPADAVEELNEEIRSWAGREGAVLVDSYAVFEPEKALLIGLDGLHPTPVGYQRLAEVFRDAIQAHFELSPAADVPPAGPASLPARLGLP